MIESRRGLVFGLASALMLMPRAGEAQTPTGQTPRIGYLGFQAGPSALDQAFQQGLRELGYVEGQNIIVEYRYAEHTPARASALAAELVSLNVAVIVSVGGPVSATAAKKATTTIPIVFELGDPIGNGVVTRLDRPGGNLTGVDNLIGELNAKRLELLKELMPRISRVFVLANPLSPPTERRLKELEDAARTLRVKLHRFEARRLQDIDVAFAAMASERPEAFLVLTDPMFFTQRDRIVALAGKYRLPGIFSLREFAEAGGLVSYSSSLADARRRLATYVDKILKGAKPGDLPIERPTKFELVINLRTAKTLGITIPPSLMLRADDVIQ